MFFIFRRIYYLRNTLTPIIKTPQEQHFDTCTTIFFFLEGFVALERH